MTVMPRPDGRPAYAAAESLLHPLALVALGTLILNDHLLKGLVGGPITGKLSDVAGLVVLPLVLLGLWECWCRVTGRPSDAASVAISVAAGATVVGFTAVKLDQRVADLAAFVMAAFQWPVHAAGALATGGTLPGIVPGVLLADRGDLVALPAVLLALVIVSGRR
jgi:hypothetical protein